MIARTKSEKNKLFYKKLLKSLVKIKNVYQYSKMVNRKKISKRFNNKIDALCYKFIIVLKIKSNLFKDHKTIHRLTTKEIKKQKRRNKCRCGKCNIFLINNH